MIFSTRISFIVFTALSFFGMSAHAQKTEVGVLLGGGYYWGDIVNTFQPSTIKPGGSLFVRYHLDSRMAVRGNFSYTTIGGSDVDSKDSKWQVARNFSFKTNIVELSGVLEYNLLPDKNKGRRLRSFFVPYVYGGLGVFYFDPRAINPVTGNEVKLRPLKLDGGGYSPVALCIPLGVGFRAYLTRNWQIGFDIGARYSLSSHLDDVTGNSVYPSINDMASDDARVMFDPSRKRVYHIKESGNTYSPSAKEGKVRGKNELVSDVYFIGGVTLSYRIWPRGARSYGGKAIRCPRFY